MTALHAAHSARLCHDRRGEAAECQARLVRVPRAKRVKTGRVLAMGRRTA